MPSVASFGSQLRILFPGFIVSALVAVTAKFLSEHYGAPAMLLALLLGLALNFLSEADTKTAAGVAVTSKTVLRIGVALLGARISVDMLSDLGLELIALVIAGVIATILFGLAVARLFGKNKDFAFLTAGSVAICGASAAMAISAVLPNHEKSERDLAFTVISVTLLSTIAMIVYPALSTYFGFDAKTGGVFLGGTIHDVAQVVGAGFSVNNETGETATLVKLIRVAMLAPVVIFASLAIRMSGKLKTVDGKKPPILPTFVIGFIVLATLNSLGVIPTVIAEWAASISGWALLIAIAAVGIKTSLVKMLSVGGPAIALIITETLFIGAFVLCGIYLLG